MFIVAIRQRPARRERISRPTRSAEVSSNLAVRRGEAPSVLVSSTPLTERPSSIWTCRSARRRWRSPVTRWRIRATWRVSRTAGGSTTSESSARRQLRATMATAVPTTTVTLAAIEVAVWVTTPCMLPMSLTRRDCTSPPRVRVKKPSDWRWRWAKRSLRRRCMTRWPTAVESQVCTTPMTAVATATPSIAPTRSSRRRTSWRGSASSMTWRTRNGWARPTGELSTMRATTTARVARCGAKSRAMRRSDTGESASWRRSAGSGRPPRRRPASLRGGGSRGGQPCDQLLSGFEVVR